MTNIDDVFNKDVARLLKSVTVPIKDEDGYKDALGLFQRYQSNPMGFAQHSHLGVGDVQKDAVAAMADACRLLETAMFVYKHQEGTTNPEPLLEELRRLAFCFEMQESVLKMLVFCEDQGFLNPKMAAFVCLRLGLYPIKYKRPDGSLEQVVLFKGFERLSDGRWRISADLVGMAFSFTSHGKNLSEAMIEARDSIYPILESFCGEGIHAIGRNR